MLLGEGENQLKALGVLLDTAKAPVSPQGVSGVGVRTGMNGAPQGKKSLEGDWTGGDDPADVLGRVGSGWAWETGHVPAPIRDKGDKGDNK